VNVPEPTRTSALSRVDPVGVPAENDDARGLLRRIIDWIRRANRIRLARRHARRRELAGVPRAQPAAHQILEGFASALAPEGLFAHGTWTQTPAAHAEAWGAYERLKSELARLRRERVASFVPRPCAMIQAPADLAAFARGVALPAVETPRVSVVIPAFNHVRETLECLAALAAHTPSQDYEVVLVDDASTDETPALLPLVANLRYRRSAANAGFIASSNLGAREARGEYLVFLNNDAQVTAGWLEPLIETFSTFERVGAVGPKILYPDGRLQDAGSMVNRDLSITMVGLDDDPDRARYNYAREVHYCTGACLVVERRRFEELGGFATELQPAYYEDCDLQLRMHEQGLRSIYQPASTVAHHLSLSMASPERAALKTQQIVRNSQRMRERWGDRIDAMDAVRLIAFYLPQFHPFEENDFWWGKGFTEWSNVAKALPNFVGHEQPHLPTDLGFYDLRVPEIMQEQARLARAYGISGFCFYYYWFHGKRLLEMPIERILETPGFDMPFCLCWANENWTRRWDGGDGESQILIGQKHSDEDDEAVIHDLMRFLRHPSYIKVHGKPVLLVYRIELFPDMRRTAEIWREACRRAGVGEIHLVRVDSFQNAVHAVPPAVHGFDAAVEFRPHNTMALLRSPLPLLNPRFSGQLHDYEEAALGAAAYKDARYLHYRGVMPRWDNTPRRQDKATTFVRSSPGAYQAWLEEVLRYTREQNVGDERLVFVNAWNEWAEGAHLEPDRKYGRGYLEATRNALEAHLVRGEE
jgi:GT2 family glycosyltransferase